MLRKIFSNSTTNKRDLLAATERMNKAIKQRNNYLLQPTETDRLKEQYKERRKRKEEKHPHQRHTDPGYKK